MPLTYFPVARVGPSDLRPSLRERVTYIGPMLMISPVTLTFIMQRAQVGQERGKK